MSGMVYDQLLEMYLLNGIILSSAVSFRHDNQHIYVAQNASRFRVILVTLHTSRAFQNREDA